MKIKSLIYIVVISLVATSVACNKEKFLEEVPIDFYSPENSFVNLANFQAALTDLDARVRAEYSLSSGANEDVEFLGTDIAYNGREDNSRMGDYNNAINPQGSVVRSEWVNWFKIISNANTIISRLPASELTGDQAKLVQAEAKLFRAWAYHHLVYLFGGVPLVLEEVTTPKSDYVRATRDEVLNQIIADATEAATTLPGVAAVKDGKLSKAVAYHLLSETYITLKDYDKAIAAATEVINNSGLSLMTTRFGSLRTQPGDVYFDLFRANNQNRGQGNNEAIWVAQYEVDIPGGLLTSAGAQVNMLERAVAHAGFTLAGPDGKPVVYKGREASTFNVGGRGSSFVRPTNYYLYTIWGLNPANDNRIVTNPDIRTSKYNIQRDFIYTNPESAYFGKSMLDFPAPQWKLQDWRWYPYPTKITTAGQHPSALIEDASNLVLKTTAGATYRDMYIIRLPETYFLRAEAYFLKGQLQLAADDLNVVRKRSNATPVNAAEVNLDYILDERARELTFEENRRKTLSRMGVLVNRVRKYNKLNGPQITDHHNLFPIPFSEIEANKDAKLEQNPGY